MRKLYLLIILGLTIATFAQIAMAKSLEPNSVSTINRNFKPTAGIEVTINNPLNNSVVGDLVTIHVSATSSLPIVKYEIYINGTKMAESNTYQWNTTGLNGIYVINAKAYTDTTTFGESNHVVTVDPQFKSGVIKFMTYNIYESGLKPQWINVVEEENPDIIVMQETGSWSGTSNPTFISHLNTLNTYFSSEQPYIGNTTIGDPTSTGGEVILSRFPIVDFHEISTLYLDDNSAITPQHNILDALIQIGDTQVHFITLHLACCETGTYGRVHDMEGLINYLDTLKDSPIVMAGDFNTFSPYDTGILAPDPGNLDTMTLDMLLNSSNPQYSTANTWTDVYRELNPNDPGYSYIDILYKSRIDYIFVNSFLKSTLVNSTVGDTPSASVGSDHFSLDAFLNFDYSTNDLRPPFAPVGVGATIIDNNKVNLTWTPNTESDFDHYNVYRESIKIGTSSNPSYEDTSVPSNTIIRYTITAVDTHGNEGFKSQKLLLNTTYGIIKTPQSPIASIAEDQGKIVISWSTPDNGGIKIDLYKIYRKSGDRWLLWGVTSENTFVDDKVNPNFTYTYRIVAENEVGDGIPSNEVSLKINISSTNQPQTPGFDVLIFTLSLMGITLLFKLFTKTKKPNK